MASLVLGSVIPIALREPSSVSASCLVNHGLQREAFTELLIVGIVLLTYILVSSLCCEHSYGTRSSGEFSSIPPNSL